MFKSGDILKRTRKEKGLSLTDVEKETKIRRKYLSAVEDSKWSSFSSRTYVQGVVSSYARYLGLDEQRLLAFFRREYEQKESGNHFKKSVSRDYFRPRAKKMFITIVSLIFFLFTVYFGYQLSLFLRPPTVEILEPKQTIFRKDVVEIVGKTEKEAIVTVNSRRVYLDDNNQFRADVPLIDQKNEVIVEVIGANGKKTVVKRIFEKRN